MQNTSFSWPPEYTLKRHPRARHIKLKASHQYGLEIVVPTHFNQKNIPEILEKNKLWIEKHLKEIITTPSLFESSLPTEIHLRAINQLWPIHYIKSKTNQLRLIIRPQSELVLFGEVDNKKLCQKLLTFWLKKQAQLHLVKWLEELCKETQLSYKKVIVREQRTRWGSCNSQKTISLNYQLLLLPAHLVRHILIHELCHTVHLNHSKKFWKLVASFDSEWEKHSREMRKTTIFYDFSHLVS